MNALLSATGIAKSFGRHPVLVEAGLEAYAGQAVAIVGENGAGKTTLLRICAGLVPPDRGAVRCQVRPGYCPQEPGLVELLTADEHLLLFGGALGLDRAEALRAGRRTLQSLGFPLEEKAVVRDLSGGTRQKLNLALALLGAPRLLLLDEPYQGFDRGSYVDFWQHVDGWRHEGRAVVVVTHLLAELERVDRVVELAVVMLAALPLAIYLSIPPGEGWELTPGAVGLAWSVGGVSLFSALGWRQVDPRLCLAGYDATAQLLGRLLPLIAIGLLLAAAMTPLLLLRSQPADQSALVLTVVLTVLLGGPLWL
ncbi:MAG TPA: ATP-binding cassette domain-containing protein, partial [Chloroflexota bacterium]|nr:ATP-binding cassette domain-containing protein [Chloroflexota bacterium]